MLLACLYCLYLLVGRRTVAAGAGLIVAGYLAATCGLLSAPPAMLGPHNAIAPWSTAMLSGHAAPPDAASPRLIHGTGLHLNLYVRRLTCLLAAQVSIAATAGATCLDQGATDGV